MGTKRALKKPALTDPFGARPAWGNPLDFFAIFFHTEKIYKAIVNC